MCFSRSMAFERPLPFVPLLLSALVACGGDATGPGESRIGAEGGTASLAKGLVTLSIPSGALSSEVEFTAAKASSFPPSDLIVPGSTYDLGPSGTTFAELVTVTLSYDPRNLPEGVREAELRLFQAAGNGWGLVLNASVDTDAHTVSGRVTSLGCFGARGLSVAAVEVTPSSYTLEQGKTKRLTATGRAASGMILPERGVAWASTMESVATAGADGLVTAVGTGAAVIVATAEGKTGSAEINSWSCSGQTQVPATECLALIASYDALNGQDWRDSRAWVPTPRPCEWLGVTCGGGSVSGLSLRGKQLPGSIPFSLGDLTNLTSLDLSGNTLSGPIPYSLGNLSGLTWMDLSGNLLSGSIPSEFGLLTRLAWLDLSGNRLSGSIPSEIGGLSTLTELNLSWNLFSGSVPPELGGLSNLLHLGLLDNHLTGSIPPELGDLSSLQRLSLGVNQMSGRIPPELGMLSNLTALGISRTQISGPIPAELGNLGELENLILWGNLLSGPVPLPVAQLGGQIQARDGGGPLCQFTPPGNTGLTIPDTQDFRDADLDADGKICGVLIGSP